MTHTPKISRKCTTIYPCIPVSTTVLSGSLNKAFNLMKLKVLKTWAKRLLHAKAAFHKIMAETKHAKSSFVKHSFDIDVITLPKFKAHVVDTMCTMGFSGYAASYNAWLK